MLPWIQVYSNLTEHPKIYGLVDRLGLKRNYEAVGIVVSLWLWAARNASDGDLSRFPVRAIAAAVGYPGNLAKRLCTALVESGWMDVELDGTYRIHDWEDHAEMLMDALARQRMQSKERSRRYRERKNAQYQGLEELDGVTDCAAHQEQSVTNCVTHHDQTVTNHAPTEPDQTKPDQTKPDQTKPDQTKPDQTKPKQNVGVCLSSPPALSWSKDQLAELCRPRMILSDSALEELLELSQGMEAAVLRRALDVAQDNGKLVWGYVKGVLKNWQSEGIQTLAQVEQREQRRREERSFAGTGTRRGDSGYAAGDVELAEAVRRSREAMRRMLEGE